MSVLPIQNLANRTVKELRQLCTANNIFGRSKLKTKDQLISALNTITIKCERVVPINISTEPRNSTENQVPTIISVLEHLSISNPEPPMTEHILATTATNEVINQTPTEPELDNLVKLWSAKSDKAKNDETNRLREKILIDIINNTAEWIDAHTKITNLDPENPTRKKLGVLANELQAAIVKIYPRFNTTEHILIGIGGRQTKDFVIKSKSAGGGQVLGTNPVEFKFGAKSLAGVPQLYQVAASNLLAEPGNTPEFAANFFDALIPKLQELGLTLTPETQIDKPTYLKFVYQPDANKHPFFKWLKTELSTNPGLQEQIKTLNHSISSQYLSDIRQIINIRELYSRTIACLNKDYILWDPKSFKAHVIKSAVPHDGPEPCKITDLQPITNTKTHHTLSAEYSIPGLGYKFSLRLCWKNGNGLLFPAWKIGVIGG
jgi:hypothetical protein